MFRCKKRGIVAGIITISILLSALSSGDCWSAEYSPNVHWVFCVDTSGSMKAKGRRDLLKIITEQIANEFTDMKKNTINIGDRITVFSFDEDVRLEATAVYQTENDIIPIREKLKDMNKRSGKLTFISEAIVQAIDFTNKYNKFFNANAVYVFTDGKSEPYSKKWSKSKIKARKAIDKENLKKIEFAEKNKGLNVWLGVLRWAAFNDAKSFVKRMGVSGHLVDLTDFSRLPLEKALNNFAQTVRTKVILPTVKKVDFGTIPYNSTPSYQKRITWKIKTNKAPSIMGRIKFNPDNPSVMPQEYPVEVKSTSDKMFLNFGFNKSDKLKPGTYKGILELLPSKEAFGVLEIEPSQFDIELRKSSLVSFYFWRVFIVSLICILVLFFIVSKIKRRMPVRI